MCTDLVCTPARSVDWPGWGGNWGSRPSPLAVRPTLVPRYVGHLEAAVSTEDDKRVVATFVEVCQNQQRMWRSLTGWSISRALLEHLDRDARF